MELRLLGRELLDLSRWQTELLALQVGEHHPRHGR